MLFLNSIMLWGLLAVSIPIIIHLLNRRRHKTIYWAAMQFLLKATRESRGKKKLRNFLVFAQRSKMQWGESLLISCVHLGPVSKKE